LHGRGQNRNERMKDMTATVGAKWEQ
jgi:hypothetical protein